MNDELTHVADDHALPEEGDWLAVCGVRSHSHNTYDWDICLRFVKEDNLRRVSFVTCPDCIGLLMIGAL